MPTNEEIACEMLARNLAWLRSNAFAPDPLLAEPEADPRRCLALVADGEWRFHEAWSRIEDNLDGFMEDETRWMRPALHHTFLRVSPWGERGMADGVEVLSRLNDAGRFPPRYTISFDRLCPVSTGILMLGTSDTDVNAYRDGIRALGLGDQDSRKCDIMHATLFRNTCHIAHEEQHALLDYLVSLGKEAYATLRVTHLHLVEASWTLAGGSFDILKSWAL